jgi:hypothetical protein
MLAPLVELVGGIPALSGRVHGAARLSELRARGSLLQACPAAFVLPLGLRGGSSSAATGLYRQSVEWVEGVVLAVRAVMDASGAAALDQIEPLIEATIGAVAGVERDDRTGVYRLLKGELLSLDAGLLIYQLDFAIEDQLRIAR